MHVHDSAHFHPAPLGKTMAKARRSTSVIPKHERPRSSHIHMQKNRAITPDWKMQPPQRTVLKVICSDPLIGQQRKPRASKDTARDWPNSTWLGQSRAFSGQSFGTGIAQFPQSQQPQV